MDCSPPGSSVHGILQARILEWVTIFFSRGSSWPGDWTCVSCIGRMIIYYWATREAQDIKSQPWRCEAGHIRPPSTSAAPVPGVFPAQVLVLLSRGYSCLSHLPQYNLLHLNGTFSAFRGPSVPQYENRLTCYILSRNMQFFLQSTFSNSLLYSSSKL